MVVNSTPEGFISLGGGMDANRAPLILPDSMYALGVNVAVRGGLAQTRDALAPVTATLPTAVFQGAGTWSLGGTDRLVFVNNGTVYTLGTDSGVLTSHAGLLRSDRQCYFAQLDKYMVIQDGFDGSAKITITSEVGGESVESEVEVRASREPNSPVVLDRIPSFTAPVEDTVGPMEFTVAGGRYDGASVTVEVEVDGDATASITGEYPTYQLSVTMPRAEGVSYVTVTASDGATTDKAFIRAKAHRYTYVATEENAKIGLPEVEFTANGSLVIGSTEYFYTTPPPASSLEVLYTINPTDFEMGLGVAGLLETVGTDSFAPYSEILRTGTSADNHMVDPTTSNPAPAPDGTTTRTAQRWFDFAVDGGGTFSFLHFVTCKYGSDHAVQQNDAGAWVPISSDTFAGITLAVEVWDSNNEVSVRYVNTYAQAYSDWALLSIDVPEGTAFVRLMCRSFGRSQGLPGAVSFTGFSWDPLAAENSPTFEAVDTQAMDMDSSATTLSIDFDRGDAALADLKLFLYTDNDRLLPTSWIELPDYPGYTYGDTLDGLTSETIRLTVRPASRLKGTASVKLRLFSDTNMLATRSIRFDVGLGEVPYRAEVTTLDWVSTTKTTTVGPLFFGISGSTIADRFRIWLSDESDGLFADLDSVVTSADDPPTTFSVGESDDYIPSTVNLVPAGTTFYGAYRLIPAGLTSGTTELTLSIFNLSLIHI